MISRRFLLATLLFGGAYYYWKRPSKLDYLMKSKGPVVPGKSGLAIVVIPDDELPIFSDRLAILGVVTVLYFRDPNCSATASTDRDLAEFLKYRPDVAVRQIPMEPSPHGGYLKAIHDYRLNIWTSPFIVLFDKQGKILASDDKLESAADDLLYSWMYKTLDERPTP